VAVTTTLKPAPPALIAGALVLAAVLAGVTAARTTVYGSLLALWTDTAAKSPHNQRALLWVGIALDEAGRHDEALAAFGRTIAADPENPACARAHTFRAAQLGRRGDLTSAVAEARRAVELAPDDGLGWVNLARGLYELGQLSAAEEAGRRSIDSCRGGERLVAMVNLARILAGTGRIREAVSLCTAVLAADPGHEPARRLLADLASRGGRR
jgi:tetratricopeptide (TPR) repeat protein